MNGVLNIFKPKGISSFKVVKEVRNILGVNKAGHTGTLDPSASGVLLVCLGQATKIVKFITELKKHYIGEMILGISTTTQDSEGEIIQRKKVNTYIDEKIINSVFQKYKGTISQIPPMFSSVHYKGKRLYHLARKGIEVKRNPRKIKIYQLNLINFVKRKNPIIKFEVECSKGTYIRTLCNDIGNELGCGAYLSNLVRKGIGNFNIENSLKLEDLKKNPTLGEKYLISIDSVLKDLERITIKAEEIKTIMNGGIISKRQIIKNQEEPTIKESKLIKILDAQGNLLAIGLQIIKNREDIIIKPVRIFKNL